MKYVLYFTAVMFLYSCTSSTPRPDIHIELPYSFEDGFETEDLNKEALIVPGGSRWTKVQQVNPVMANNAWSVQDEKVSEGAHALHLLAQPSDDILSKMDIEKQGFYAPEGSTIRIEADFFIKSTSDELKDLFLIDVECCSCWDPSVDNNQCPGIRLKLSEDNFLSIERGKILGSSLHQTERTFPLGEWVNIIWQMELSPDQEGLNILYINGEPVLQETGHNMPNAAAFKSEFEQHGIEFELQAPLVYERIQIGATANPTSHQVEMYVDDFRLNIE